MTENKLKVFTQDETFELMDLYGYYCMTKKKISDIRNMLTPKEWYEKHLKQINKDGHRE